MKALIKPKFLKGDVVEVINNYNGSCFEQQIADKEAIGQRFIIKSAFIGAHGWPVYVVEGLDMVFFTGSNIILYKRPIKNWIKLILSK